jgi:ribosomal protein S18 acetylase RimI-like enzyme
MPERGFSRPEDVMNSFASRAYAGASDLALLIEFAENATRARWPLSTYLKGGDVVWMLYNLSPDSYADVRLWFDDADLIAYACFEPPLLVDFDIQPGSPQFNAIADEILMWAENRRRGLMRINGETIPKAYAMLGESTVSATVLDSDPQRISILERNGYSRVDRFHVLYSRSVTAEQIRQPKLDGGLRLRHATDADLAARVEVHRDAWSVWGPSSVTVETYRRLRAAPLYNPELDVVLEDVTGRFLSYCVGWLDPCNEIGHFEPVGCRPDCAGRGYARAVTIEAMRRMQMRGMHTALVGTESVNEPAQMLYKSCGFVEVDRAYFYTRRIGT